MTFELCLGFLPPAASDGMLISHHHHLRWITGTQNFTEKFISLKTGCLDENLLEKYVITSKCCICTSVLCIYILFFSFM